MKRKNMVAIIIAIGYFVGSVNQVSAETYEYDKLNRLKMVTYDNGETITYEYDANGNIQIIKGSSSDGEKEDDNDLTNGNNNGTNNSTGSTTNNEHSSPDTGTQNREPSENGPSSNQQDKITNKTIKYKNANYTIFFIGGKVSDVQLSLFKDKKAKSYIVPNTIKYKGKKYKVTSIGKKAFYKKTKLQKITIGKYVKTIGNNAFHGNKKLITINVNSTKLTTVGKNALKGTNKKLKIRVKSKKYNTYKLLFKNKGNKKVKVTKK